MARILPVALFAAFEVNWVIPDADAPIPDPSSKAGKAYERMEKLLRQRRRLHRRHEAARNGVELDDEDNWDDLSMARNYSDHYDAVLDLCSGTRIWGSQSITPEEALRGQASFSRACMSWAQMNCHLTPYNHIACHFAPTILRLGPTYGFHLFGPESNNGRLVRVNNNGHTGGELECTMMRSWVKYSLIHDLVRCLFGSQCTLDCGLSFSDRFSHDHVDEQTFSRYSSVP